MTWRQLLWWLHSLSWMQNLCGFDFRFNNSELETWDVSRLWWWFGGSIVASDPSWAEFEYYLHGTKEICLCRDCCGTAVEFTTQNEKLWVRIWRVLAIFLYCTLSILSVLYVSLERSLVKKVCFALQIQLKNKVSCCHWLQTVAQSSFFPRE